jgi:hypothetical protein
VLWILCVILMMLWLLGLVTGYTMDGVIHILPVIAIIIALIQVIQGRRLAKNFAASWSRRPAKVGEHFYETDRAY